jgi:hypothetical protein
LKLRGSRNTIRLSETNLKAQISVGHETQKTKKMLKVPNEASGGLKGLSIYRGHSVLQRAVGDCKGVSSGC